MASAQIISPKSDEHTSNTSSHLQEIQAWGELYIFDLPKPLRTALFTKNLITFPYGTSLAPQARIEESEEIWTDNPGWINRIKLFDQAYRFDFFRCVLPESFGRESGLISEKPLTELKRLQYDDAIFGHRRWSLIIIGKEKIAALHLQTDLLKGDENETIKDRLVILKNEVIEPAPVVEGKKGRSKSYSKSKKEKAVEKLSRKSQRGVDRDTMNKAGSELLASWEKELERSELIFVGASKKQISTFFPESSLLYNKLRAFPFTFGAPTIEELKMCYLKLTTAKLDIEL